MKFDFYTMLALCFSLSFLLVSWYLVCFITNKTKQPEAGTEQYVSRNQSYFPGNVQ